MPWSDVIAQERVTETLARSIESGRVAHAYLFFGPDGVGKRATAIAFAQALLCERGTSEGCGKCLACTRVARLIHPDLHLLFPYPNDTPEEEVGERLRLLAQNPYAAVDFVRRPFLAEPGKSSNRQSLYTIERVHEELRRAMSFRPVEGRFKVAVLTDADLLRVEAANAFLKLLEEPSPQTVFVLTTTRLDRILPTIASRCQKLRFDNLPAEEIEGGLVAREGLEGAAAATLARMADGSYLRALELSEQGDVLARRESVLRFFRQSYGRSHELDALIEELAGSGREQLKGFLKLTFGWMHDLLRYRTLGDEAPLVNVDQRDAIARFCRNVPGANLEAMVARVEEALELVERNVNAGLVLRVLGIRLYWAMRAGEDVPLYVPLTATPQQPAGSMMEA